MAQPSFDIIVFGATSFVGQIVSRYLADTYGTQGELAWAAAGRSQVKLEALRDSLGAENAELSLVVADAADEEALRAMCAQTKVVISTVGPYALYGETLVKVCAETGTDYCDLTGEVQWINRMLHRYEPQAKASGARIVHCCGFDSIPSDLGVYYLQQQARDKWGKSCNEVRMRLKAARGKFSGGTIASLVNVVKEAAADPILRKELADPYLLCPAGHGFSERQRDLTSAAYDKTSNTWSAPFVMAAINTRIVHRSNALQDNAYGSDFRYGEVVQTGQGTKGRVLANLMAGGMAVFTAALAIGPTRGLLERFILPKPGEGPTPDQQENGFFDLRFHGKTDSSEQIVVKVTGDRDPGYGSTARMLSQAAVCLALDITKDDKPGGFWTPASIFGDKLFDRLQTHAGLSFKVLSNS